MKPIFLFFMPAVHYLLFISVYNNIRISIFQLKGAQVRSTFINIFYSKLIVEIDLKFFKLIIRDVDMSSPLSLREDIKKGENSLKNSNNQGEIYVQGISEFHVKNVKETLHLLKTAEKNRKIRETALNLFSSRSHSIFQV